MDSIGLPGISEATEPAEKAAIIAESVIEGLPAVTALVARRCVILHWFDLHIVSALLPEGTEEDPKALYDGFNTLPFIEARQRGLAYHDLTRQGLLRRYADDQPDLLVTAAGLAAPAYETRDGTEDEQAVTEAFFCYMVAGKSEEAISLLDRVLAGPLSWESLARYAYCSQVQHEAEALPFVGPLVLESRHWIVLGLASLLGGDPGSTVVAAQKAVALDSENVTAYVLRGLAYAALKDYARAIADYDRAIELNPEDATAYYNRGVAYADLKDYARAIADYERAIQLNPEYATAYNNRGVAYADLKDYARAIADYDRASEMNPQDATAYYNKACVYALMRQAVDACRWLSQAISLDQTYREYVRGDSDFDAIRDDETLRLLTSGGEDCLSRDCTDERDTGT